MQSTAGRDHRFVLRRINQLSPGYTAPVCLSGLTQWSNAARWPRTPDRRKEPLLKITISYSAEVCQYTYQRTGNMHYKDGLFYQAKTCSLIPHSFQLLLPLVSPLVATSHHLDYPELTSSTLCIGSHQHKQFPSPLAFISRRKHIKSHFRVSPHPHRIHFKSRNAADQEVSNGPPTPPASYVCHFSQRCDVRDTTGS